MKRLTAAIFVLMMCLSLFACGETPVPESVKNALVQNNSFVYDEAPVATLKWSISTDGTLTVSGEGKMSDEQWNVENLGEANMPWADRKDEIKKLVIEEGITSISHTAFLMCEQLTSVSLPNSLRSIGHYAFVGCEALNEISIPKSVMQIGVCIFEKSGIEDNESYWDGDLCYVSDCLVASKDGCKDPVIRKGTRLIAAVCFDDCSFTSINIPASVENVGFMFTGGNKRLEEITVDEDNKYYCSVDGVLYTKDMKTLVMCPAGETSCTIPDGVTTINTYAFRMNQKLDSLTIPASVRVVGDYAFDDFSAEVIYKGTDAQWNKITIGEGNEALINAKNGVFENFESGDKNIYYDEISYH